ncbi:MAG: hypothetical protein GC179_24445 [Anaerolineaceae bacterium]|nr:hypothetical protein [Anaerolineaceae bacterium]
MIDEVWLFNGTNAQFPSGIFSSRERAEEWIQKHRLSGILTKYPVDISVYDWAIENGLFRVKDEEKKTANFIQRFSSASQEHYHYENGEQ